MDDELERKKFLDKYAEQISNARTTYKSTPSLTTSSYVWTCRNTGCDVISIITTVVPIRGGYMKDIKQANLEPRNKMTTRKSTKTSLLASPLEEGLVVDVDLVRKKISAKLRAEKRAFMQRLNVSRNIRYRVEANAAVRIQSIFRGFAARKNLDQNITMCTVRKSVRARLLAFLADQPETSSAVKTWAQFRGRYSSVRNSSALIIQCAFRRFISKKCLARKRVDMMLYRKHISVIKIQTISRRAAARMAAQKKAALAKFNVRSRAASLLQLAIRSFLSRRRLSRRRIRIQWVAARMIQCWFRGIRARRLCFIVKKRTLQWKQFFATRKFQCVIRNFLARRRMKRINARANYLRRFNATRRIQSRIRGWLARSRVRKLRVQIHAQRTLDATRKAEEEEAAKKVAEQKANLDLLQSVNIFYQARAGRVTDVDDIFHCRVTDEPQSVSDTDSAGDTVLTIAASTGNTELCRKCFLWGFDVNHRNVKGHTALMCAVLNRHPETVQYILQAGKETMSAISRDDAGAMLVAAASGNSDESREILRSLIALELSASCASPESGMTALHAAAECGDIDTVNTLLRLRAPVDAVDDMGQTPLHKACKSSLEIFNLLLSPANNPEVALEAVVSVDNGTGSATPEPPPAAPSLSRGQSAVIALDVTAPSTDGSASTSTTDIAAVSTKTDWRVSKLLKTDIDGKDCILLAILNGKNDILAEIESVLSTAGVLRSAPEEIGWSPNDITAAHKLAEQNNFSCLDQLFAQGFDATWVNEDNGLTLAMTACKFGSEAVLDLLLEQKADLSITDTILRRTAMHYAATCKSNAMLAYLLTHSAAANCKISESGLTVQDANGHTPIHVAAIEGVDFSLDLIARKGLDDAITLRDKDSLTPLMLACSYMQLNILSRLVELGADPKATDNFGHDSLWHLFHPHISTVALPRPIICSELLSRTKPAATIDYPGGTVTRREDAIRVAEDVDAVLLLLRKGCRLYPSQQTSLLSGTDTEAYLRGTLSLPNEEDCGDILVREKSVVLLRSLPALCSVADCWRLIMACIRFDSSVGSVTNSNVCLKALVEAGITQSIVKSSITTDAAIDTVMNILTQSAPQVPLSRPTTPKLQSTKDVFQKYRFHGRSLIAWAIFSQNYSVFEYVLSLGVDPMVIVDDEDNNCLHFVARHGTTAMMSLLLSPFVVSKAFTAVLSPIKINSQVAESSTSAATLLMSQLALGSSSIAPFSDSATIAPTTTANWHIRLEACNKLGRTATMEAARVGNVGICKQLVSRKASARDGLKGKYYGFLLALARRQERVEINTQTGITESDDTRYFNVAPDPSYTVWYN